MIRVRRLIILLKDLLAFLDKAERKFEKMGPLGADIDAVKRQIDQLKNFKAEVDPHMVKVEALNRSVHFEILNCLLDFFFISLFNSHCYWFITNFCFFFLYSPQMDLTGVL